MASQGLFNSRMLWRGVVLLAPIFIAGLVTGDPMWFRVQIITISVLVSSERSGLTPAGVLVHTLAMGFGIVGMTLSLAAPQTFVLASIVLAVVSLGITALGSEMRWTGTFTFIPVLYLAYSTSNAMHGASFSQVSSSTLPYILCAAAPVIVMASVSHLWSGQGVRSVASAWLKLRHLSEAPVAGCYEGIIAAAFAVGVAASLVEWQHVPYAQWLVWSAASVVTGNIATARIRWKDRMVGAIVGVPVGALVGLLMPHAPLLFDLLTAGTVLTLVAFNRYVIAFGTRCGLHATAIIVAGHAASLTSLRAVDVIAGGAIGIVFVLATHSLVRSLKWGPRIA